MTDIRIKEFTVVVPGGHIYVKQWCPRHKLRNSVLILLHDSLGSIAQWRDFPAKLAKRLSCRVIAYDRLGFGLSSPRNELPSVRFVEEEALVYFPFLKASLAIDQYMLLGHSVGGGMAINIAAIDSDCNGLVTLSAQSHVEEMTLVGIQKAKKMFAKPEQIAKLKRWHQEKAPWVIRAWTERWLSREFRQWNLKKCIANVYCPVLVIHGDQDEYGSNAFPEFISANTSGSARKIILKDCGHAPHKEKTEVVIDLIEKFF